ncbi:MAG TPA: TIGR02266 family protein [Kofleriaceae bacterium]|nr:TIGR02266 family protein [Kofleriaceae bacterium]
MTDRELSRAPYSMAVEFRSASSFLIAYSTNLSRGGLFLETPHELPVGTSLDLALQVPGAKAVGVQGQVAWRRAKGGPEGPPGVGVEVAEVGPSVGQLIDRLVSDYHGIAVLVVAGDGRDRGTLKRLIQSVIATADPVQTADAALADTMIGDDVDLVVVDLDGDPEGGQLAIRRARSLARAIPVVAVASTPALRTRAQEAGAGELIGNPPTLEDLRLAVLRALGRPLAVRGS